MQNNSILRRNFMKKIFAVLIMCVLVTTLLVACKQETTANVVAKNLDKNLNTLSITVNKLDTIDNKYIANPDLYSSTIGMPNTNKDKFFALTFKQNINTDNELNDLVKQMLVNRIKENLLNQNTINRNDCYSCKKYCDNNGNCYYTDCNGNNYMCDSYGNCSTCPSIPSSCSYVGNSDFSGCPNATSLSATTMEDLNVERLSLEQSIQDTNADPIDPMFNVDVQDDYTSDNITEDDTNINDNTNIDNSNSDQTNITDNDQTGNDSTNTNTNDPKIKIFYFTQESFTPYKLKYQPRYITQYNENDINSQIEAYLFRVQKLYAMTEDSIEANTILAECRTKVIDCIAEIRELNNNILSGNCEPSIQQLEALKNYIDDLKITIGRLKNCNGELSKEVNNINNSNGSSIINSVDVLNSRYLKLLNHIDTRITYHKSAMATLEQIKYLLNDTVNGNTIDDEQINSIVENSNMTEDEKQEIKNIVTEIKENELNSNGNITNTYTNDIVTNCDDSVINSKKDDNIPLDNDNNILLDDTNSNNEENKKIETSDNIFENEYTDANTNINNDETIIDTNNTVIEDTDIVTNDNLDTDASNVVNENVDLNNDEASDTNAQTDSIIDDTVETDYNIVEDTDASETTTHHGNIDTYNDDHTFKNIDTYKNNNDVVDNDEIANNDIPENNEIVNNDDVNNDHNYDFTTLESRDERPVVVDDNFANDTVANNTDTVLNGDYNGVGNGIAYDGANVNNSGMYHNSVITQNNLDTNNGYGGYYYTADGQIKNNGMNNNNEIGNNGQTIETNLNSRNNVNTYGYNTMLDIINQGTVNNGINTL